MAPLLPEFDNPSSEQLRSAEGSRLYAEALPAVDRVLDALRSMLGVIPGANVIANDYVEQPVQVPESQPIAYIRPTSVVRDVLGLAPSEQTLSPTERARRGIDEALANPQPAQLTNTQPQEEPANVIDVDFEQRRRIEEAQALVEQAPTHHVVVPATEKPEAPVFNLSPQFVLEEQTGYVDAVLGDDSSNVVPFPRPSRPNVDRLTNGADGGYSRAA